MFEHWEECPELPDRLHVSLKFSYRYVSVSACLNSNSPLTASADTLLAFNEAAGKFANCYSYRSEAVYTLHSRRAR